MKEKATYRKFDLFAVLAILGCIGMLLFECIFIFELYDRAPSQVGNLLPVQPALAVKPAVEPSAAAAPAVPTEPVIGKPVPAETNAPSFTNAVPVRREPVEPAETEKTPARREPVESVEPVTAPVG